MRTPNREWRKEYEARNREQIRARQRELRSKYAGRCETCGAPTDGSNGRVGAPRYCHKHVHDANRVWTREAIINAIQTFHSRYGRQPVAGDWNPAQARARDKPEIAEAFYRDGDYPVINSVRSRFGSWNAAIEAAGFAPRPPGDPR